MHHCTVFLPDRKLGRTCPAELSNARRTGKKLANANLMVITSLILSD
jgi:hypothetical protein